MKKFMLLFVVLLSVPVMAQNSQNPSVSVSGEGIIKIVPDQVLIKSRIEHEGPSATSVKKQNDEIVNKIINYLKAEGIDEKDFQTNYVNLNKRYDYNEKTYTYIANQSITIKLKDIGNYERIMKGLLENGLNRIDGIQFLSSEIEKYEQEARRLAVLDAQNKAKQLASPLGQEIGKAISISEMDYNNVQPLYRMEEMADMSMAKTDEQTIAPGEMELKIRVNVSFELLQ
ncbi:SIMPL domain-containing protein [Gramella sp. GC03-9]|uniref:SIMPL domain-containing protein n=1 Tax=Christiangramia oceanisediminis TaxID=2920386 RepID=A0A9X2I9E6_9FLAO|nr:SIMPL domain-containing protein [Gramella oceanisediminis]MCP9199866.1 SIMPL domain-containing protein [Gramella oceanisediminis]